METTTRLLLPEVTAALKAHPEQLIPLTEEMHPADLADLASALDPGLAHQLLNILSVEISAKLLEACTPETRLELFGNLAASSLSNAVTITDAMAADDRADLYAELPEELRSQLLDAIDAEESRDIRQLLSYPEHSAGALLTTDFVALPATATAEAAIELVRKNAAEMETIYQAYAVDSHHTLLGVVSLRDLVTSPVDQTIDRLMNPNIVTIHVDDDQEEAARLIAKYDLLALPVVDRSHHIVGIITVDDVLDVVEEEATEDVHKLGAIEPIETPYPATPLWQIIRARIPWLIALFAAVLATERMLVYYNYHSGLTAHTVALLLAFVPVITSSGGNSGTQSATLVIRSMAIGRIEPHHTLAILRRELFVGLALGTILAVLGGVWIAMTGSPQTLRFTLTVSLALISVVTVAVLLGSGIPLLLRRLRIDPAVSSTPFIASVVDFVGVLIFFRIAIAFLH